MTTPIAPFNSQHLEAACRVLAERSLKAMVTASNIALDKRFHCEVRAGLPEALKLLRLGT